MTDPGKKSRQRLHAIGLAGAVLLGLIAGAVLSSVFATPDGIPLARAAAAGNDHGPEGEVEWTCSMHPEVRLPDDVPCPKCGMDLIPVPAGGDLGPLRRFATSEAGRALMNIETMPVERRPIERQVRMTGRIDYDETRVAYIAARFPGRLDRLFVDYTGVQVRQGDHLVEIYSPELLSAQAELLQAVRSARELASSDMPALRRSAEATLEASREKLRLWGLTGEQIAAIESGQRPSEHLTIHSPISGVVVDKAAREGLYVQTGTRIYTIADLSQVWVTLDAYESDIASLRYGQTVEFTSIAQPGETFTGQITFIQPVLDDRTRTVQVRVDAPNPDGLLKPGMFVRAVASAVLDETGRTASPDLAGMWISPMHPQVVKDGPGQCDICGMDLVPAEELGFGGAGALRPPLVIPASAVLKTGTRAVVYVAVPGEEQPTFEGRQVVLGPRAGEWYVVRHGLQEGELVVTRGNFKIDSALQIAARPSMMSPNAGMLGRPAEADELPALFRHELRTVLNVAGDTCQRVSDGDLSGAREGFAAIADALEAVDTQGLTGRGAQLWGELQMRLAAHAAEGATVATTADARRVADALQGDLDLIRTQLAAGVDERPATAAVPDDFARQLEDLYAGYVAMATALAADDGATAAEATQRTLAAFAAVDASTADEATRADWHEHAASLESLLHGVQHAGGIDAQRVAFDGLSVRMIDVARRFPPVDGRLYVMHCPMAFNDRGADWLQSQQQLANPYYGAMMLRCGAITEVVGQ